jgi:hypothetical protein
MFLVMHTEMLGQKHGVWHRSTPKTQGRSASELAYLGLGMRVTNTWLPGSSFASSGLHSDCMEAAHVIRDCS